MSGALRHRGIEAWLEDSNGAPIPLTQAVDTVSNKISTWVHIEPRKCYTLRWRTFAGFPNISALCEVYLNNDLFHVDSANFRVARLVMDSGRRLTQSKTTKGWLNPPYKRFGCLRIRRRMGSGKTALKKSTSRSDNSRPPLGSVRLEVRRVNGRIPVDPHWEKEPGEMDVSVIDTTTMDFLDDPAENHPPWIVFEFKFKENPLITARIEKENEDLKDEHTAESQNAAQGAAQQPDDTIHTQPSSSRQKRTMDDRLEINLTPRARVDESGFNKITSELAARKRLKLSNDNRRQSTWWTETPYKSHHKWNMDIPASSSSSSTKGKRRMSGTRIITPSPDPDDRSSPDSSNNNENTGALDDAMGNYGAVKLEEEELTLLLKRKTEAKQQNIKRLQRLLQE